MKLIVGLGNPGRKYEGTRHNIGFAVLAEMARRHGTNGPRARFAGETVDATLGEAKLLLLCPHTYMNRSGQSVQQARDFYKIELSELIVVGDDFNLDLHKLRFRAKGSAGGQKGLADIIQKLGTEEFARLRIGIGPVPANWDPADFVLGKFSKDEAAEVQVTIQQAADALADWVRQGIDYCMNRYN